MPTWHTLMQYLQQYLESYDARAVQIQKFKLHAHCMQHPISIGDVGLREHLSRRQIAAKPLMRKQRH